MFIIVIIIICLFLYGSIKLLPETWSLLPELLAKGDIVMIVSLVSCIIGAILAIFNAFEGWKSSLSAFLWSCTIGICINACILVINGSYHIVTVLLKSTIFQFQFASPIGIITAIICFIITRNEY